jgi:simple sugar transport system permease protein
LSEGSMIRQLRVVRSDPALGTLLILALLAGVGFAISLGGQFLNAGALESMAFQLPELGILALAMMVAMLSGGINLSIVATANATALTIAIALSAMAGADGSVGLVGMLAAVAGGLAVAAVIGLLNGFVIAYVGVSPILATLGTMTLLRGVDIGLTHGGVLSGFPPSLLFLGNGKLFGIPVAMFVFLLCVAPLAWLLNRTALGLSIYLIGSNEKATRFSGVDTRRVLLKVYVISSLLCAIAAIVMMARFNSVNASYGESYLLITILAAVLGGVDPFGGFGKTFGVVLALVILQMTASGFNLLGLSSHLTLAIWGLILIGASAVNLLRGFNARTN